MKSTPTLRFPIQRLFLLTLVSFVAVAAVLGIAASANKANRAAKALQARQAQAAQAVATKSANVKDSDGQQPLAPSATVITATLDDNLPAATKVPPGGTINYTAVIKNTGTTGVDDAAAVNYTHPLDGNTSLVAGSVHASPIAFNNAYTTAIGNTLLEVSNSPSSLAPKVTAAGTLFDNDTIATAPDTIVLQSFTAASANGGTVAVNANGSFTYLPPVGFTGSDTFTYTVRNSVDATLQDTATVTITVNAPRVWYVDNSGANGDGRSTSPFNTLANAAAVDAAGDIIYIFTGAGNYTGGITLLNNEQVIGNGVALVVNTITLRAAGSRPTVVNAGGAGVTLGQNDTLTGFNFGASTGFSITGASVGTLTVNNMLINNTTGGALDLTGVGTPIVSVVLDSTTSTGGTKNVNLVGLNGTITLSSGALSAATSNAFDVSGGAATITFTGTIGNTTARSVNVANMTGGSVALSGAVSGSGSGINLTTNTGATISFTGGISLSTGANAAFTATGGGTVTATQNNTSIVNTLTTTTGTALNITSTTIGGSGLAFRSITSNGSSNNNGITLDGAGAGGLTVSGNGGSCTSAATCTGGTISNKTGADGNTIGTGIYVNNTSNVSITRMKLNDFSNYAVRGTTVTNFTMNNCFIDGVNGSNAGADEGALIFDGLFGTSSFSTDTIKGGIEDNFRIANTSGTSIVTVDSCTIRDTSTTASGNDNLNIRTNINANINIHVTNNTFAATNADHIQTIASDQSILTIVATGNTLSGGGGGSALGQGITISGGNATPSDSTEVVRFNISSNNMTGTVQGGAININQGSGNGNWQGQVLGNTIGNAGIGCSGASQSSGVRLENHSKGVLTGIVTNNIIHQTCGAGGGISLTAGDTTASGLGNGALNATVFGNTIDTPGGSADHGVVLVGGAGVTGNTNQICLDLKNNSSTGSPVVGSSGFAYRIRQRFQQTVFLPGYGGANNDNAAVIAYFSARPNTAIAGDGGTYSVTNTVGLAPPNGPGGGFVNGGAQCTQPTVPTLPPPVDTQARNRMGNVSDSYSSTNAIASAKTESAAPPVIATRVAQVPSPVTAMASALINRSEAALSHHAVRNNSRASGESPNAPLVNVSVNIGTLPALPAGKTVTIKYAVTVNNAAPTSRQISAQGNVTYTGGPGGGVNTTDPGPPIVAGPTITLIDTSITWTGATNTDWNTPTNWNLPGPIVSAYAPGVSNPAINEVTIPAVATQPTISGSDIGVYSLSLANTMTLTITNPRVLTIGGSPGGDLTLNGVISGGFLNLGTGTHAITNSSATGSISATNVTTVLSGSTVTLANSLQMGALGVNAGGIMNITNQTLSLNGSGAALTVPGGATFTTTGSTVVFNGTAAQQAAGIAYNNLTINNTIGTNVTGVTLTGNATVNGALALTSSDLNTGGFTLTQPNTTPSTGVSDVVGTVTRTGGPFALATPLTFGNPNNIITFTVGTQRPTTLTVLLAKTAPATYAAAVTRNYTISLTGTNNSTSTLRLRYLDPSELNGNVEAQLNLRRLRTSDSHWVAQLPTNRDTANNWVESNAVLPADLPTQWTFSSLAPTGTDGVVTGRIVDQNGNPVEGAVVRLAGTQDRKFITDANGVYRFDNVETNGLYTVTPARVNYTFNPSSRSFSLVGETTEAAFGATATGQIANPLDTPEYFVRQHYIDFLGREPDEAGFNFWSDQILECGTDNTCIDRRRENVSAAYFLSTEFQQTGGLVDSLYKASYGAHPEFAQFMPDTRTVGLGVVVGREGWQAKLQANKQAFIDAFVNRAAFHAAYDGLSSSDYVDALISHTGVSFTAAERDELLSGLGAGTMTRADVLRSIAENNRFVSAKFNEAFVMMEYFGYLRRDADSSGFAFWLNKLNEFDGNFERADMVKAFIVAGEYRDRFPR